jgi:nicotinamide-nucleotide amidase
VPDPIADPTADELASAIATALRAQDRTVAVAESLTGGLLANALARADGASTWFRGAVVAYASEVKHGLLAVRPGPVVSAEAAADMAEQTARLLDADVVVAVTGVGGPDPQDGEPPGTVWLAVTTNGATRTHAHRFAGDPAEICRQSVVASLECLRATVA